MISGRRRWRALFGCLSPLQLLLKKLKKRSASFMTTSRHQTTPKGCIIDAFLCRLQTLREGEPVRVYVSQNTITTTEYGNVE